MPNQIVVRPPFRKRGQMPFFHSSLSVGSATGSGGVKVGGSATVLFGHGQQVASDVVVEWDFDNDGDFSEGVEDITSYVLSMEVMTGRDWPSLLTGKAGPGKFRATLRNDDDRFNYFNTSSPLNAGSFSLKTGRKVRVRTSTATNPDPALLAKDRFGRSDGALGTPETGAAWTGPLANDFAIVSKTARPATEGQAHIGLIDVADTDYYAQCRMSEVGAGTNVVGLVYRYQDTTNYSLAVLDVSATQLKLIDVVAGTPTTIESESVEVYDDITIGVLVSGSSVTFYHEGVPVFSDVAIQTDETDVGIYASWGTGDVRPAIDDFYVWESLPSEVEGILWTGDISDLVTSVQAGPQKLAVIQGNGWLSRLATQRLQPMRAAEGKKTGVLVGNVLSRANLSHPPFMIDEGDITTGPVAMDEMDAIEAARRFEETEFGFLHETQEGYIAYDSRTARDASTSQVTFTDAVGGQYGYSGIEPLDWRREIVNRVIAGVAPSAPSGVTLTERSGTAISNIDVVMPATVTAGDLLLVNIIAGPTSASSSRLWIVPQGWSELTRSGVQNLTYDAAGALSHTSKIFVKVAVGDEDGDTVRFGAGFTGGAGEAFVAHVYRVTDWFGSIDDGVAVSDYSDGDDPTVVFPSWGPSPSLFLAFWSSLTFVSLASFDYPLGYTDGTLTSVAPSEALIMASAQRVAATEAENPGSFQSVFDPGSFYEEAIVVAIRGYNGEEMLNTGVATVQLDDLDSQADHNSIRTHADPSNLFADTAAATTYAQLVLDKYADDRPIIALQFYPTKSAAYRSQAIRRRVSDRITLVAVNNSGLGISQDFFIESINHQWSNGTTLWSTRWELSPA